MISNLSGKIRNSIGMARLVKPVGRVLFEPYKLDNKVTYVVFFLSYISSRFIGKKTEKQMKSRQKFCSNLLTLRIYYDIIGEVI